MGTRGAHIFVCPGRPRPFLARIWAVAPSNGIGAEKSLGYFESLDDLYSLGEFQQNRPKGLREIRDRPKFLFMGTTIVVPIYAFVGVKRGVVLPGFNS